ncbi:MAG: ATP-binding protein [Myxococcota bacterium]|nr:ATP-binding protein [Myxococcota bacterium]
MSAQVLRAKGGRVLIVGTPASSDDVVANLMSAGYECAQVSSPTQLLSTSQRLRPEAVLFTSAGQAEREAMVLLRGDAVLRDVPLLADLTSPDGATLRKLAFDDWIHADDQRTVRLEAALRSRRLVERDLQRQRRMEKLLEITQAATSTLELGEIMRIAVEKISEVVPTDRCSVVLVEGVPRTARVVASRESPGMHDLAIDLIKYPELRRALETRQPILVEDAQRDPLMEEVRDQIEPLGVRSILVQPLICQDDLLGALFLRMSRESGAFGRDELEFSQGVSLALANSVRNARLHTALKRKRDELESAYVDRYRELNEANRRLKDLNRLKDEIIAIVSHDLRAPLQVLLGHGRLLQDTDLTDEQKISAEAINRQGRKILDLVESLLERGKGEQARVSIEPVRLDAAQLCKDVTSELTILAKQRGKTLRSETPESLVLLGDEVKLAEIFQNLITNALDHARTTVLVRTQRLRRPDGDQIRISVQDDGPGIPADQLALVFDKYRHGPGGTGLGLAICKEFVELHGGEIWAEKVEGGGARFVITLALAQQAPTRPPPALGTGQGKQEEAQQPRVLVVEDEPQIAAVLEEILKSRYRVEVARDGAEGLAKARGLHPDLVVMDVFLPKLDGLDAAMALKSSPDTSDIPVILLSAHQGVAEKVRALNLGAVDYMHKPFQALELLARTDRALRLREAERELERSRSLLRRSGNDPETGLFDRLGVVARLEQELSRSRRYQRALSVAVLTPLMPLRDRTRACASFVRTTLRAPDVVGHLGGGRLVILLPESSAEDSLNVLARLKPDLDREGGASFHVYVEELEETQEGMVDAALEAVLVRSARAAHPRRST